MGRRIRLAVTPGDPAGVGPEILRAALASDRLPGNVEWIEVSPPASGPGHPTPDGAKSAWECLEECARLAGSGAVDGVVTGPVCKSSLREVGFPFPGQTEFFADRAGVTDFAMCLTSPRLTVGLVTAHVPLAEVPARVTAGEIFRIGRLLAAFVASRRGGGIPIAVAGLNPHAGENGQLGTEEQCIIAPAVQALNAAMPFGQSFQGPFSPDTIFHRATRGEFSAVLCMYHDQGLIPLKLDGFDEGVNTTLGLPFVRTSPDHGTAFAIAGSGEARPDSMIAAMRLAAEIAEKRP